MTGSDPARAATSARVETAILAARRLTPDEWVQLDSSLGWRGELEALEADWRAERVAADQTLLRVECMLAQVPCAVER